MRAQMVVLVAEVVEPVLLQPALPAGAAACLLQRAVEPLRLPDRAAPPACARPSPDAAAATARSAAPPPPRSAADSPAVAGCALPYRQRLHYETAPATDTPSVA